MNHKNIKNRYFKNRFRLKKNRFRFFPFKNEKTDIFQKSYVLRVNCMKPIQFDQEESENRGTKVPWFILQAPKPKNPKLGQNLKFIISQFPFRFKLN